MAGSRAPRECRGPRHGGRLPASCAAIGDRGPRGRAQCSAQCSTACEGQRELHGNRRGVAVEFLCHRRAVAGKRPRHARGVGSAAVQSVRKRAGWGGGERPHPDCKRNCPAAPGESSCPPSLGSAPVYPSGAPAIPRSTGRVSTAVRSVVCSAGRADAELPASRVSFSRVPCASPAPCAFSSGDFPA